MKLFFIYILFFSIFSGCSLKNYNHTSTKLLTLKTQKLKFSDIAYLRHSEDAIELDLFVAGKMVSRFHINHLICVENEGCLRKASFNEEYLTRYYPDDILQNILLGREIYQGKNKQKFDDGFVQLINTQDVAIKYKVTPKSIYFKDKKNHILIKIKDLQQ